MRRAAVWTPWLWGVALGGLVLAALLGSTSLVARWGRWCEGLVGERLEPPGRTGTPSGPGSHRLWRDVGYTVLCLLDLAVLAVALGTPLVGVLNYWNAEWLRPAEW